MEELLGCQIGKLDELVALDFEVFVFHLTKLDLTHVQVRFRSCSQEG